MFLTPKLYQFGEDDEAGFLCYGVRDVDSPLDYGEEDPLDVFQLWTDI